MRPALSGPLLIALVVLGLGLALSRASGQGMGDLDRGAALYRGHCAACHGLDGDGNGPRAVGMTPPPTNFRDAAVMGALSDNAIEQAILAGKAGTDMQGYGTVLSSQEVASLVQYLRLLIPPQ